jgi:hypothetical protein
MCTSATRTMCPAYTTIRLLAVKREGDSGWSLN